jgi:hypothetical protein
MMDFECFNNAILMPELLSHNSSGHPNHHRARAAE